MILFLINPFMDCFVRIMILCAYSYSIIVDPQDFEKGGGGGSGKGGGGVLTTRNPPPPGSAPGSRCVLGVLTCFW